MPHEHAADALVEEIILRERVVLASHENHWERFRRRVERAFELFFAQIFPRGFPGRVQRIGKEHEAGYSRGPGRVSVARICEALDEFRGRARLGERVVCFLFFGVDELTQEVAAHARAVGLARQDEPQHAFFQRHPHQAVRGAQAVVRIGRLHGHPEHRGSKIIRERFGRGIHVSPVQVPASAVKKDDTSVARAPVGWTRHRTGKNHGLSGFLTRAKHLDVIGLRHPSRAMRI